MTTTVIVTVREDCAEFHGVLAHASLEGDGSPEHFQAALRAAMREAGINLSRWVRRSPRAVEAEESLAT